MSTTVVVVDSEGIDSQATFVDRVAELLRGLQTDVTVMSLSSSEYALESESHSPAVPESSKEQVFSDRERQNSKLLEQLDAFAARFSGADHASTRVVRGNDKRDLVEAVLSMHPALTVVEDDRTNAVQELVDSPLSEMLLDAHLSTLIVPGSN